MRRTIVGMPADIPAPATATDLRERIVSAAAALLRENGRGALTTRAVEAAAGIQAPTIYRLFGDKQGLIGAVAEREISDYVARKRSLVDDDAGRDPVEVLADAWRTSVHFGLEHPDLFRLMHDAPPTARMSEVMRQGEEILRARVRRVAVHGRLTVSEDRAVNLIIASVTGATFTLIAEPEPRRDLGMLDDMLGGLLATIISEDPPDRAVKTADAAGDLRAAIAASEPTLSRGEAALLDELLQRLAARA